jgi:hypothetical protein
MGNQQIVEHVLNTGYNAIDVPCRQRFSAPFLPFAKYNSNEALHKNPTHASHWLE